MPHERRHAREPSKDEQQYIILVKDIPRACRWQELKDMTRLLGGEQSLKAEVFQTRDGPQVGHCTIKGKVAAQQVFDNFCQRGWNGLSVEVSLAVLEKPDTLKPVIPMTRTLGLVQRAQSKVIQEHVPSANVHGCFVKPLLPTTPPQPLSPMYHHHYTTAGATLSPNSGMIGPQMCAAHVHGYVNPGSSTAAYNGAACNMDHMPAYSPVTSRPRGKSGHPSTATQRIGNDNSLICISGLPYSQSEHELSHILRRFGSLKYLELPPDTRSHGKCKGTAKAMYANSSQAIAATRNLDGMHFGGRKISVRLAKDDSSTNTADHSRRESIRTGVSGKDPKTGTPVLSSHDQSSSARDSKANSGPLVVNGATGSTGSRSSRDDACESDNSTEDSDDESKSEQSERDRRGEPDPIPILYREARLAQNCQGSLFT
ncbi:hypothetical protein PV10_03245 [Exophiala mesophila]|uniref:RRM domain-containing protein n=1 Tax=Exophiala mesophila TaxID=212818 RepID=A0A0D1X1H6_EXOME|nr:uncharacterized protein PV10_03245 [Exophiala mesophila]KIV95615.1 hypothetical protein PV10_03245 [Exophiala mesophila]